MKEIIKKIKKIIKKKDPDINVENLNATIKGNSVNPDGSGQRKPLVILLANITDMTQTSLIEKAQKHNPGAAIIGVRFKNFIDKVKEIKEIKEPILSSEQETEDYWKKLYDESKTYAQNHLWWREVFLGNIRS